MFCPKCGNQLNDGAVFCPKCGLKISDDAPSESLGSVSSQTESTSAQRDNTQGKEEASGSKKKKSKVPIIALVSVAVVAVAGGIGAYFVNNSGSSASASYVAPAQQTTTPAVTESAPASSEPETTAQSDDAALTELVGYIGEAEELIHKSEQDALSLDTSKDSVKAWKDFGDSFDAAYKSTDELRQKADAVKGLDSEVKSAADDFFDMTCSSFEKVARAGYFYSEYFEKIGPTMDTIPAFKDYGNDAEFLNAEKVWYETTLEAYDSVEGVPASVEAAWKKCQKNLDLYKWMAEKDAAGETYGDLFRMKSAVYLTERFKTVDDNNYMELLGCIVSEQKHAKSQRETALSLAGKIKEYAELDEGSRNGFDFEYGGSGKILLGYETVDTIYPSLFNSYDAFVIIKTGCLSGTNRITVEAEIEGFTQKYKETVDLDDSYRAIYVKPPALTGNIDLSSAKDAQIAVGIYNADGSLIEAKTFPVTIKSRNDFEWYSSEFGMVTQDNILCFLTPESEAITELKRLAIDEASAMTDGRMSSLAGYQGSTWSHEVTTYLQAAALMRALYEKGVRYNNDGFSVSGSNQHILLPYEVLEQNSGLCIETSLVIASALQSMGMHAFLVFPPSHAQVAVETWDGSGEYLLIETTALSERNNSRSVFLNYASAMIDGDYTDAYSPITYKTFDEWREYLRDEVEYIIDCDDSRILGMTPFVN